MFAAVYCIIPTAADICAELISQKVVETLTNLKVQHVSNEVRMQADSILAILMYRLRYMLYLITEVVSLPNENIALSPGKYYSY